MGEFDLIARYFSRAPRRALVGVGDDCALIEPKPGTQMAISCDMLVAGRHFLDNVAPRKLGHKALAVNLSDLAACGAKPLAFTLALSLPSLDEGWLAEFSTGLMRLADAHDCELIGGDTTAGPLNLCITVFGEVQGSALLRSGARAGDDLYVSGHLGDARLALRALTGRLHLPPDLLTQTRDRLEQPEPRIALGLALRGWASAAIDLSDGLAGDLGHMLKASGVGATLEGPTLTGLLQAQSHPQWSQISPPVQALDEVLAGGDDYELAFTAPPALRDRIDQAAKSSQTPVTRIGRIDTQTGLRLIDAEGRTQPVTQLSFDHFKAG
ncbi:MAG: thiamine-phosphate kinase [Betaproteobacteria bacterium]|nr:thiamine-phosphate kinase [Betaproteobacteria bacterium]